MINLKHEGKDIRIKKINPTQVNIQDAVLILSKYYNQSISQYLANIYMKVIGYEEFVVLKKDSTIYELSFSSSGCINFEKSEKFNNLLKVLLQGSLSEDSAYKCAVALFFLEENAVLERKRISQEQERIQCTARELPTWMPVGYKYVTGNMYEGIVIEDDYGNQFTYIPYMEIYISRYEISLNEYGRPVSLPDRKPWVNMSYKEAEKAAREFDPVYNSGLLTSMKNVMESINKKTGIRYPFEVYHGHVELRTGAIPQNMIYNIDCLSGNHYCILQMKQKRNKNFKVAGYSYRKIRDEIWDRGISYIPLPSKYAGIRICLRRDS